MVGFNIYSSLYIYLLLTYRGIYPPSKVQPSDTTRLKCYVLRPKIIFVHVSCASKEHVCTRDLLANAVNYSSKRLCTLPSIKRYLPCAHAIIIAFRACRYRANSRLEERNVAKPKTTGVDLSLIERMKKEGKLKQYDSIEEAQQARAGRKKRGVKETPAHLLPDDHYRKRKRANITLGADARAIAKKIGNGVISRGCERALLHWHDCPRTDRRRK